MSEEGRRMRISIEFSRLGEVLLLAGLLVVLGVLVGVAIA